MKWLLAIVVLVAFLCSPVYAYDHNFTPVFDPGTIGEEVHYNVTYVLDDSKATPWWLWAGSGLLALVAFLWSIKVRSSSGEVEADAVVSVVAWAPAAFCAYTSFAVDVIEGYGVTGLVETATQSGIITSHEYVYMSRHIIYHFDAIGFLMMVFTFVCVLNTIRIILLHNKLALMERGGGESRM